MNDIDTSTVGGRIRSCRKRLGLNLEGMANQIGVSPNYVSIIERNVKTPSDKVLRRVADLADVTFDWLRNGAGEDGVTMSNEPSPQPETGKESIDASLFLNLILCDGTAISKETIATILDVDAESLEGILRGEAQFDPAWDNGLSNIAQRLELPDMIEKLQGIVSFLENVQTEKTDYGLIRLARDWLSETFEDEFSYRSSQRQGNGTYTDLWRPGRHDGSPVRTFYYQQKAKPGEWRVQVYAEMHGSLAEEALFRAIDGRPSYNDINTVLILTNKEAYDRLASERERIYRLRLPDAHRDVKKITVALALLDLGSMCIKEAVSDDIPADKRKDVRPCQTP